MAVKFKDVYGLFLSQITDYELGSLDREEIEVVAKMYLLNSLLTIQETITDVMDIDMEKEEFKQDLTFAEQLLLAKAMKLTWVREQKYKEELMRKSIGDRDYKAVQGTDYLKVLTTVESELYTEIRRELMRDSWGKPNSYSGLMT